MTEDDRISMSADEFFDLWHEWVPRDVSVTEADLLTDMPVNILKAFEDRGSATHGRQMIRWNSGNTGAIFSSPDVRKNG